MKTFLICFSGIDGSGKTTLCKKVITELQSHQIPSRYVYGRFLPATMAPLFKLASSLMLKRKNTRNNSYVRNKSKKRLLQNPIIAKVFVTGIFFDQLLRVFLKIYLPSLFKRQVIICDRYLFDTIVTDIALSCDFNKDELTKLLKQWIRIFPKSHQVFLIYLPPEVAYERKKDMHSLPVLEELSKNYMYTAKKFGATILDGTQNPFQLKDLVMDKLRSLGVYGIT